MIPQCVMFILVFVLLVIMSCTDISKRKIFNKHTVLFIPIWILYLILLGIFSADSIKDTLLSSLLGMIIVSVPLLIISLSGICVGGGDIKLSAGLGLCIGAVGVLISFLVSCGTIILWALISSLFTRKKINIKKAVPVAPFMTIGACVYCTMSVFIAL